ncbi:hypothetical protein LXL04_007842 [Taraxacum kok-saghyz]
MAAVVAGKRAKATSSMKYHLTTPVIIKGLRYIACTGQKLTEKHWRNTPPPTATKATVAGGGGGYRKVRKSSSCNKQPRKSRETHNYIDIRSRSFNCGCFKGVPTAARLAAMSSSGSGSGGPSLGCSELRLEEACRSPPTATTTRMAEGRWSSPVVLVARETREREVSSAGDMRVAPSSMVVARLSSVEQLHRGGDGGRYRARVMVSEGAASAGKFATPLRSSLPHPPTLQAITDYPLLQTTPACIGRSAPPSSTSGSCQNIHLSRFNSHPSILPFSCKTIPAQVLLGDIRAGKSSLVLRFVKGQFLEFQESTIGAAFSSQTLAVNDATVKFEIWDTAGQERYHSSAPMYYRGAAAAIFVYDITSAVLLSCP